MSENTTGANILAKITQLAGTDGVIALKNGTQKVIPFTILGSIFLLFSNFPLTNWNDIMSGIFGPDWAYAFNLVSDSTFNLLAVVIVLSISYEYAKLKEVEAHLCSMIALVCFLVCIPHTAAAGDGSLVGGVFSQSWTGGAGSITAIIVALFTGWLYCKIVKKDWTIKMPESVPKGVYDSFISLIPGLICITVAFVAAIVSKLIMDGSFCELIFSILQLPMQLAFGTLAGSIFTSFMISIFWVFGIHSSVVGGVVDPIFRANSAVNQGLIDAGIALTAANGAYIATYQLQRHFMQMTGSGIPMGLILAMIVASKSQRYKALGRMSVVPSCFNVMEPVLFGFPIAFNFRMAIPYTLVPIAATILGYVATAIGFLPMVGNFDVPWTCPGIISGFMIWGWRGAVIQILILAISFFGYYPFFRAADNEEYAREQELAKEEANT